MARFRGLLGAVVAVLVAVPPARGDEAAKVTGFVDASYAGVKDTKEETFGLDQVEIDLERAESAGGLRADLEWVKDGESWGAAAEQGYLFYRPLRSEAFTFTLGKFNAPIGFEMLDAPDMYQFSHALVFTYALPTNLTGAIVAVAAGRGLHALAYVVNGWDRNQESNGIMTAGGRLQHTPCAAISWGASAIRGPEGPDPGDMRTVFDADLTLRPHEGLLIGGEANRGEIEREGGNARWTGFLLMAHVDFGGCLGLTGRFDYLDDADGVLFGAGVGETRTAVTVAPTFNLGDGMGALVEIRVDSSNKDVFVDRDGKTDGSEVSAAFEMTFTY